MVAWDEFQRQLRETGTYDTRGDAIRPVDRLLGRFDWWFYLHILRIVYLGGRDARTGRYDASRWSVSSYDTVVGLERCGCQIHISGTHALAAAGGPAVIVANHMSMAETFVLPCIVQSFHDLSFVIKASLLKYPYFGDLLGACYPISVGRKHAREDLKTVLEKGQQCLAAGRSVVVFPQATRSVTFVPAQFNTLGVKLAARAGVPVVPLALKTDFQGTGRLIKDFGPLDRRQTMHFQFAPPMDPRGREKEVHAATVAFIRERVLAWGGRVKDD